MTEFIGVRAKGQTAAYWTATILVTAELGLALAGCAPSGTSHRAASPGHAGRARSYASACAPNDKRRGTVATL